MFIKPVYDHRFFLFISQLNVVSKFQSGLFRIIAFLIKFWIIKIPLTILERIIALILVLPIPLYSSFIYIYIKSVRGFSGFYIRALYYSIKAKKWKGNILIDEDVIFENIGNYEFDEFCMIDKKVIIASDQFRIGKGCHIAMNVTISKGGEVIMEDFSAISYGSILITTTDSPDTGTRTSGPMIPVNQRNIIKGKIILRKDSMLATNVIVYPDTVLEEGAIASPKNIIRGKIDPWKIRILKNNVFHADRERIKFDDPSYDLRSKDF